MSRQTKARPSDGVIWQVTEQSQSAFDVRCCSFWDPSQVELWEFVLFGRVHGIPAGGTLKGHNSTLARLLHNQLLALSSWFQQLPRYGD